MIEGSCACGVTWRFDAVPEGDHFDGLETWQDLPRDGRCVRAYWF